VVKLSAEGDGGPLRWTPRSADDVLPLIANGLLEENHYFEIKREVGSTPGERKETARDMASLAIDGGDVLIGVQENKVERTWSQAPIMLAGLGERIEQIATQVVDPPLFVTTHALPLSPGADRGFILVHIPPSHAAPHMVDGVYFGRGERTRTRP
jgi:hypothetical protein